MGPLSETLPDTTAKREEVERAGAVEKNQKEEEETTANDLSVHGFLFHPYAVFCCRPHTPRTSAIRLAFSRTPFVLVAWAAGKEHRGGCPFPVPLDLGRDRQPPGFRLPCTCRVIA